MILNCAFAKEYVVGGSLGWIARAPTARFYDSQFANTTLVVGDTLRFPYNTNYHNVYIVSEKDLAMCDGRNPIVAYRMDNTVITLNRVGIWSFICQIPGHCTLGMHLQVTVYEAAAAPTQAPIPVQAPVPAPVGAPTLAASLRAPTLAPAVSTVPFGVSPSMSPASSSSPEAELSPESMPSPSGGSALSSVSLHFGLVLSSVAACSVILFL